MTTIANLLGCSEGMIRSLPNDKQVRLHVDLMDMKLRAYQSERNTNVLISELDRFRRQVWDEYNEGKPGRERDRTRKYWIAIASLGVTLLAAVIGGLFALLSRSDGGARGSSTSTLLTAPPVVVVPTPDVEPLACETKYIVRAGETLDSIAAQKLIEGLRFFGSAATPTLDEVNAYSALIKSRNGNRASLAEGQPIYLPWPYPETPCEGFGGG